MTCSRLRSDRQGRRAMLSIPGLRSYNGLHAFSAKCWFWQCLWLTFQPVEIKGGILNTNIANTIRSELRAYLRDDFEGDFDNRPIAELGLDSLEFFELIAQLEDEHGLTIDIESLDNELTLVDLVRAASRAA